MSKESKPKADQSAGESFSVKEIRNLLDLLDKHEVSEFQLERGDDKLWLRRGKSSEDSSTNAGQPPQIHINSVQPGAAPVPAQVVAAQPPAVVAGGAVETSAAATNAVSGNAVGDSLSPPVAVVPAEPAKVFKEVSSPMVGTFYRRPAVDADPYVEIGDSVKKGDVLCIVEAMKLMNEIESDVTGTVVEICLEDGQMVEYGEVLFRIEPA